MEKDNKSFELGQCDLSVSSTDFLKSNPCLLSNGFWICCVTRTYTIFGEYCGTNVLKVFEIYEIVFVALVSR